MFTSALRRLRNPFTPRGAADRVAEAHTAWRHRKALRELPGAVLRDVGLTRADVEAEARRPFWDVPANWRR